MSLEKKQIYHAAVYLRLSREDGDKAESDSIHNQRELIRDSLKNQQNIKLTEEYVDDGYSGTNFERPAFKQMMDDVHKGKIDCIAVKDLSRLGRNYIETGRLLEKVFPIIGVRFIAINDHYDSLDDSDGSEQMIIPFKNLINDAYCKDISSKIRSQLDMKRRAGQFIGSFACYGYNKDPKNKNHLVIDEYSGKMVRYIFNLKLDGYSSMRIAEKLDELGVLTPLEYKKSQGLDFNSGFRAKENPKWSVTTVNRILKNETYTGSVVQGKHEKINYKVKTSRAVPESEWLRVQNMHDAIVTVEEFNQVQDLLKLDTRTAPTESSVYMFAGFIRCKDCGQSMVRRSCNKGGKSYIYYYCSSYKNGDGCSSHMISDTQLEKLVILAIRQFVDVITQAEEVMLSFEEGTADPLGLSLLNQQMIALTSEAERYRNLKIHLYQDMQDGVVGREEYREINDRFSVKLKAAEDKLNELMTEKNKLIVGETNLRPWMEDFKEYRNLESLDRKIVVSLIKEIIVEDKNHIEVHFRFEDELRWLLQDAKLLYMPVSCYEQRARKEAVAL